MTTLAPVLDLVGDVESFSLFRYRSALWVAYIRASGELELHQSNAGVSTFISLETADTLAPKAQVAAVALADVLCLAWRHAANGAIYFSLWSFATSTYVQAPIPLWVGASPSLKVYKSTGLVMAYVDGDGQHVYRISKDGGLSWSADPVVVDPINVLEVDLDVYPETENVAYWAERA